jgi:hypothetical protein
MFDAILQPTGRRVSFRTPSYSDKKAINTIYEGSRTGYELNELLAAHCLVKDSNRFLEDTYGTSAIERLNMWTLPEALFYFEVFGYVCLMNDKANLLAMEAQRRIRGIDDYSPSAWYPITHSTIAGFWGASQEASRYYASTAFPDAYERGSRLVVIPHDSFLRSIELGRIVPRRITDPIYVDWEDLSGHRESYRRLVAKNYLIPQMGLENWVVISQTTSMTLEAWLELGEYEQEAITIAVRDFLKKREDANKEAMSSLKSQFESAKPHRSLFSDMPLPGIPSSTR